MNIFTLVITFNTKGNNYDSRLSMITLMVHLHHTLSQWRSRIRMHRISIMLSNVSQTRVLDYFYIFLSEGR